MNHHQLIENDDAWLMYTKGKMKNRVTSDLRNFGDVNGYANVNELMILTRELMTTIQERIVDINNGGSAISEECATLIVNLVQIITKDIIIKHNDGDSIAEKLRQHNIDSGTARVWCGGDDNENLVTSITDWTVAYSKVISSNSIVKFMRRTGTTIKKTKAPVIAGFVMSIVISIAIIPVVAMLLQCVDQYRFNVTGMPEFSSAFTEFEEVSNPDVIGAMTSAILAYRYECNRAANAFSLLKSNTPGASIPPHGTGKYGSVLDSTDEPILSSLALERPGDQSKLALAKGALESGIHLIKTNNADDKYVLSLYTYAKQNENLVSDLFHEQMRVDMSMKIGAIVKNAVLDDDVRNDMINILKQFIKDRSDSFSSTGFLSYQNSWVDEIAHTFDGQAMSNIPLMDIMVAINTGNLNLYKRGLSRLFQQYTSYINWHKNTIRNVLVQLPPDQKFYAMYQTPGQQAVDTLINYYLYPLFEYGKATLIAGRDSPISEYVGWKNAMTHYPYLTLLASFGSGGTLTKIRDKLPGANLLGGTLKVATSMAMGGGFGASALGLLI
ncbi:hypothetical protein EhV173 [Emiliania huxleyi virus 86]|uniref:Putative membrane protein n=1 Tax=Emiliania huxleyi virus 86 (isolate United Kingdom/English Channel/1999) TaxID=654925 RepID=Q4A2W1_EHV8U|nr:hypothetical protein EhV173 [Emiliania huxleyi virus 86]AEO97609.1 hypothetical protein ENVG_00406 [Emiliania huxleyi virus 84]AEP15194.1 hypothetical protein EOVG_00257 [Emiliania huxleyi virus 88]CAI65595.1 putative membrane protein [Emiliania huxleyi virus 86]